MRQRLIPQRIFRRKGAIGEEGVGLVVGRDHADLGAELDREIAQGEPALDLERPHGSPGIFDGAAGAAGSADLADEIEDHVLGRDARRAGALEADTQALGPALHQALRRQHMRDLAGADAEGERPHAAMGTGVAVAADEERAGKAQAQLRPDDMDDTLAGLADIEQPHAMLFAEVAQILEQPSAHDAGVGAAGRGGDGVVGRREGEARIAQPVAFLRDIQDRASAAQIVQQMAVDMEQGVVVAEIGDDVLVPDLVEERLAGHSPITAPNSAHCLPSKRARRMRWTG